MSLVTDHTATAQSTSMLQRNEQQQWLQAAVSIHAHHPHASPHKYAVYGSGFLVRMDHRSHSVSKINALPMTFCLHV